MISHLFFVLIFCLVSSFTIPMEQEQERDFAIAKLEALQLKFKKKAGEPPNTKSLLHDVAYAPSIPIDEYFLCEYINRGGNVNEASTCSWGLTPLHFVLFRLTFTPESIKNLLKYGASVTCRTKRAKDSAEDYYGYQALHILASRLCYEAYLNEGGQDDFVKILLQAGADIDACTEQGDTAMALALEKGNLHIAKLLMKNGITCSDENLNKWVALGINHEVPKVPMQITVAGWWLDHQRKKGLLIALWALKKWRITSDTGTDNSPYFSYIPMLPGTQLLIEWIKQMVTIWSQKGLLKDLQLKIISHMPELIPDTCLPKFYLDEEVQRILDHRLNEKAEFIQRLKSSIETEN